MYVIKSLLTGAVIMASVGLTACQSNPMTDQSVNNHDGHKPHHGMMRDMRQHRAQHEAMNQACVGKTGQTISVTVGDKTLQGTCETVFRPDHDAPPRPTTP